MVNLSKRREYILVINAQPIETSPMKLERVEVEVQVEAMGSTSHMYVLPIQQLPFLTNFMNPGHPSIHSKEGNKGKLEPFLEEIYGRKSGENQCPRYKKEAPSSGQLRAHAAISREKESPPASGPPQVESRDARGGH
jgi:hypothetical protein